MQNVIWVNKKKIKGKRKVSFSLTQTPYSYSQGFGIIEVLISAMIIVVIVGAAVGLGRTMVKRNVEAAEKVQAYNLVRGGLEIGRVFRDTQWIDKEVNEWNETFPDNNKTFIFTENASNGSFEIELRTEGEKIEKDGIEYIRKYEFRDLSDTVINDLDIIVDPNGEKDYELSNEIKVLNIEVSWNSGQDFVQASTILTDWKPGGC